MEQAIFTVLGAEQQPLGFVTQWKYGFGIYTGQEWNPTFIGAVMGENELIPIATKMIWDKTGETYRVMPTVTMSEITTREGEKTHTPEGWYKHTQYFIGDQLIGSIQTRSRNKRIDCITITGESCVIGSDLAWLCRQAGKRLSL